MPVKSNIKNYTTSVPVERTISLIEQELVKIGASEITKSYSNGAPSGIVFSVEIGANHEHIKFCIPTNEEAALEAIRSIPAYRSKKSAWLKEQARRTVWRIVLHWVQAQVAMVQLKQAEALEVFLPYVYDAAKNETLFNRIKSKNYSLLLEYSHD